MKIIARVIFWITGWKIAGEVPPLKKFVVILAPHTSGLDFFYAMCTKFLLGIKFSYLGKEEIFRPPFGFIFRWLGGIPVERTASHNMVDQVVKYFNEHENFILALSPEGTRAYVPKWKTGFYYIALKAKVPIILGYLNFETKTAGIGPTFYPTGNIEQDMESILAFYRPIKGKHPELGVR